MRKIKEKIAKSKKYVKFAFMGQNKKVIFKIGSEMCWNLDWFQKQGKGLKVIFVPAQKWVSYFILISCSFLNKINFLLMFLGT